MRRRIIFLVVIGLVLISLIAMAQQKLDRVIKVEGTSAIGHLNSIDITAEPAPSSSPSSSPSPSRSPSASTSRAPGGGEAGGGSGQNDQPSADVAGSGGGKAKGPGSDHDKRLRPPWIGDPSKDRCPGEDWQPMIIHVTGAPAPTNEQPPMAMKWTDCTLERIICGKSTFRKIGRIDNSESGGCERLAAKYKEANKGVAVCCSRLKEKRKRPDKGCDATEDADCDGVPNEKDDYPLDPNLPNNANDSCSPDKLCSSVTAALQYVNSAIENFQSGFNAAQFKISMREHLEAIQKGMSACKYPSPLDPNGLLRNFPEADRNLIPRWLDNIQSALKQLKANFLQSGGPCSSGTEDAGGHRSEN